MSIIDDIKNLYNRFVWNNPQPVQQTVTPDFSNITEATPNLSPVVAPQLDFSQVPQQPVIDFSNITEATPNMQPFVAPQIDIMDLPWFTAPTTQVDLSPVISPTNQVELKPLQPIELPNQLPTQNQSFEIQSTEIPQIQTPLTQTPLQTEEIQSIDTSLNPFTTQDIQQSKLDIIDKIKWVVWDLWLSVVKNIWVNTLWDYMFPTYSTPDITWVKDLAWRWISLAKEGYNIVKNALEPITDNMSVNRDIANLLDAKNVESSKLLWQLWWDYTNVLNNPTSLRDTIFPSEDVKEHKSALMQSNWEYSQYFNSIKNSQENIMRRERWEEEINPLDYNDFKKLYSNNKVIFDKQKQSAIEQQKKEKIVEEKRIWTEPKAQFLKDWEYTKTRILNDAKDRWDYLAQRQNLIIIENKFSEHMSNINSQVSTIDENIKKVSWWLFWEVDAVSTYSKKVDQILKAQYSNTMDILVWKLDWKLEWTAWEEFLKQKISEKYWISNEDFNEFYWKTNTRANIWELMNWYLKWSSDVGDYNSVSPEEKLKMINWDILALSWKPWFNVAKWFNLLLPITTRIWVWWDYLADEVSWVLWWSVHALKSLYPWNQNFAWLFKWDSSIIRETSNDPIAFAKSVERVKREWAISNWLRNATLAYDDVSWNLLTAVSEIVLTQWSAWLLKVWEISSKLPRMMSMMTKLWLSQTKAKNITMMWYKVWNNIWTPIVSEVAIENILNWLDPQAWSRLSEDLINLTLPLWIVFEIASPAITMARRAWNWATSTTLDIIRWFQEQSLSQWNKIDLKVIDAIEESYERAKSAVKSSWKNEEQIWLLDTYLKWLFINWTLNQNLFDTAFREWVLTKSLVNEAFSLKWEEAMKRMTDILSQTSKWVETLETFEVMKSIVDDSKIPFYDVLTSFVPTRGDLTPITTSLSTQLSEPLPRTSMYQIQTKTAQYFPKNKRITTRETYTKSEVDDIIEWLNPKWENNVSIENNFIKQEDWVYKLNPENLWDLWITKMSLSIEDLKTIAENKESIDMLEKTIVNWKNFVITKEQLDILAQTWTIGKIESVLSQVFC